jgi:hypothetical protein
MRLEQVLQSPVRAFGDDLPLSVVQDEYGRFKIWSGNVGAHQESAIRTSLDYRLRDARFYKDKIVRLLQDLDEALKSGDSLLYPFRSL